MKAKSVVSGYNIVDGEIVINESEALIIRGIFEMFASGKIAANIADNLNTRGIKTFSKQRAGIISYTKDSS